MPRRFLTLCALAAVGLAPIEAWAGKYDLSLTPLGTLQGSNVVKDREGFRSLSSELGVLMAPKAVDPADSLGLSGFAVAADFSINTIGDGEAYWQQTADGPNTVAPTMQIMGRKGLWPGVEVGGGATHLFDSKMWALAGYGKIAFHEGFHHLPIPSIAARGMFSRLVGAPDFNMTTASVGVSASHVFGLGKTFSLTPYLGYDALLIISRSAVLDATPNCDEYPDGYNDGMGSQCGGLPADVQPEFVFKRAGVITRHRPYFGVRFIFSVIRLTFEAMFVPAGNSSGDVDGVTVEDQSQFQQAYTFSVGLDF